MTDYAKYTEAPQSGQLTQLAALARTQFELEQEILQDEQRLKFKQEKLKLLAEKHIPEAMEACGMREFRTAEGISVAIKEVVRAGISDAHKPAAFAWLDAHGYSNLVKRKFICSFGKDEEAWARKFAADLARRKRTVNVESVQEIHHRTLVSFVKEKLEAGVDLPLEIFGVYRQNVAKVTV